MISDGEVLPDDVLREAPTYTPRPHEIADLELLLSDAYAPLTGFVGQADLQSLRRTGRLTDGTAWPVPVTLEVPQPLAEQLEPANPIKRVLVLTDLEGAPIAAIALHLDRAPVRLPQVPHDREPQAESAVRAGRRRVPCAPRSHSPRAASRPPPPRMRQAEMDE